MNKKYPVLIVGDKIIIDEHGETSLQEVIVDQNYQRRLKNE